MAAPKAQRAAESRGGCRRGGCCGAPCVLLIGLLFLAAGVLATFIYVVFTPVYETVTCGLEGAQLQSISGLPIPQLPGVELPWLQQGSDLKVAFRIETRCWNPNPYSLSVEGSRHGGIFVGFDRTQVGTVAALPPSWMPAQSNGTIFANQVIRVDAAVAIKLVPELIFGTGVPIWLELDQDVKVTIPLFFGFSATRRMRQACGMMLATLTDLVLSGGKRRGVLGPMACADSFDELTLPAVGATPAAAGEATNLIAFQGSEVAPEEVERATVIKNATDFAEDTISVMVVGYGVGFVLLCCGLGCCCSHLWRSTRAAKAKAPAGTAAPAAAAERSARADNEQHAPPPAAVAREAEEADIEAL